MDIDHAAKIINSVLLKENPAKFSGTWVHQKVPKAYSFICKNVRTELGDIDWDSIICKLDRPFQERWNNKRRKKVKKYRNIAEVRKVMKKFENKRYVFIAPLDENDRKLRGVISVALARVAQKGNIRAEQELVSLLRFMVDQWIEYCWQVKKWRGYSDDLDDKLKACIRCYRFTGTFIGYVFKTLEYSARGLRSMQAYSLDETISYDGEKRRIENVVKDVESGEIKIYSRN